MNGTGSERVGPMLNPPHLGELVGESMDEVGWNVTEAAARPSVRTRSPVATLQWQGGGVSAKMAHSLEALGWGTAEHWMRMQASYDVAQERSVPTGEGAGVRRKDVVEVNSRACASPA